MDSSEPSEKPTDSPRSDVDLRYNGVRLKMDIDPLEWVIIVIGITIVVWLMA